MDIKRNCSDCNLSSCLDVVPDETKPWNPLIAPQAIVTNKKGIIGGESAGIWTIGAVIWGCT